MKPWAWLAIIVVLVAAFGATYAKGHSSGYDKRNVEIQNEILEAQERTRLEEEAKWAAAVKAAQENIRTEEIIVENIRVVEKEIPKIIEKIVTLTPECSDLGPDYARLLNDQIRAANSLQSPEPTPSVDDGV